MSVKYIYRTFRRTVKHCLKDLQKGFYQPRTFTKTILTNGLIPPISTVYVVFYTD